METGGPGPVAGPVDHTHPSKGFLKSLLEVELCPALLDGEHEEGGEEGGEGEPEADPSDQRSSTFFGGEGVRELVGCYTLAGGGRGGRSRSIPLVSFVASSRRCCFRFRSRSCSSKFPGGSISATSSEQGASLVSDGILRQPGGWHRGDGGRMHGQSRPR